MGYSCSSPTPLRDAARERGGSPCLLNLAGTFSQPAPASASAGPRTGSSRSSPASGTRPRRAAGSPRTSRRAYAWRSVEPRSASTPSATCSSTATARPSRSARRTRSRSGWPHRVTSSAPGSSRARGCLRRRRRVEGIAPRVIAVPAHARVSAGARRRGPLALHRPEPGRRGGPEPGAAAEELRPFTPRRSMRSRGARRGLRAARCLRCRDGPADERVGRGRAARPRPRSGRDRRSAPLRRRRPDALPEDRVATTRPTHDASSRRGRPTLPPRLDTPLLFPASRGGYIGLDTWRNREWYPALDAAGIAKRGPYHLRHTFATEALASSISIFELARLMGASVKTIDKHYGHLARDSEAAIRARLDARASLTSAY